MKIRCIGIDDEPFARKGLARHLSQFSDFELIAQFADADELLTQWTDNTETSSVDVLFVDIEMPRCNGFELIKRLPKPLPVIVFVTAYDQYAIKAFESQALDYVLKPINENRFNQVIARIRSLLMQQQQLQSSQQMLATISQLERQIYQPEPEISVKTDEGYFQVKLQDVLYLEAAGDHVALHFESKDSKSTQLLTRATLKTYLNQLVEHDFRQIHKSYLVNLKKIVHINKTRFGDYQLTLSNNALLRVSRTFKEAISGLIDR